MIDLDSRIIGSGTNTNSKKLILGSRVSFDSRVSPNQVSEIHILFLSIECDYTKLVIQFLNL